jgi:hypothetical protein
MSGPASLAGREPVEVAREQRVARQRHVYRQSSMTKESLVQ